MSKSLQPQQQHNSLQAQILNLLSPSGEKDILKINSQMNTKHNQQNQYITSPRLSSSNQTLPFSSNNNNNNNQVAQNFNINTQLAQQNIPGSKRIHSTSSCLSERNTNNMNAINATQNPMKYNSGLQSSRNKSQYNSSQSDLSTQRFNDYQFNPNQKVFNGMPSIQNQQNQYQAQFNQQLNGQKVNQPQQTLAEQLQNNLYPNTIMNKNSKSIQIPAQQQQRDRIQLLNNLQSTKTNKKEDQENIDIPNSQRNNLVRSIVEQSNTVKNSQQSTNTSGGGIRLLNSISDNGNVHIKSGVIPQQEGIRKSSNIMITQLNANHQQMKQSTQPPNTVRKDYQLPFKSPSSSHNQNQPDATEQFRGIRLIGQNSIPKLDLGSQQKVQQPETPSISSATSLQGTNFKLLRSQSQSFGDNLLFQQKPLSNQSSFYQQTGRQSLYQSQALINKPQPSQPSQSSIPQQYHSVGQLPQPTNLAQQFQSTQSNYNSTQKGVIRPHSVSMTQSLTGSQLYTSTQHFSNQNRQPNLSQQLSPKQNPMKEQQHVIVPLSVIRRQHTFSQPLVSEQQYPSNSNINNNNNNSSMSSLKLANVGNQLPFNQQNKPLSRSSSVYSQGTLVVQNNDVSPNLSIARFDKKQLYSTLVDRNGEEERLSRAVSSSLPQSFSATPKTSYQYRQIYQNDQIPQTNLNQNITVLNQNQSQVDQISKFLSENPYQYMTIPQVVSTSEIKQNIDQPLKNVVYSQVITYTPQNINHNNQVLQESYPTFGTQNLSPLAPPPISQQPILYSARTLDNHQFTLANSCSQQEDFEGYNSKTNEPLRQYESQMNIKSCQLLQSQEKNQPECMSFIDQYSSRHENINYTVNQSNNDLKESSNKQSLIKVHEVQYDSPINIVSFALQQSIQNQGKSPQYNVAVELTASRSPSKFMDLTEEEKIWNLNSPQARKVLAKQNIDKFCDNMIEEIAQEKKLRSIEQQKGGSRTPIKNEGITISSNVCPFIAVTQDKKDDDLTLQEESTKQSQQQNIESSQLVKTQSSTSLSSQLKNNSSSKKKQSLQQNGMMSFPTEQEMQNQSEFIKVDDLLKQQQAQAILVTPDVKSKESLDEDLYEQVPQHNKDQIISMTDPVFTLSDLKKNASFEQEKSEELQTHEYNLTPLQEKSKNREQHITQQCNFNSENQQNSIHSLRNSQELEQNNKYSNDKVLVIEDQRCQSASNSKQRRSSKNLSILQDAQSNEKQNIQDFYYNDMANSYYLSNHESDQKSVVLKKFSKYDTPGKMFQISNQKQQLSNQHNNNSPITQFDNSNKKAELIQSEEQKVKSQAKDAKLALQQQLSNYKSKEKILQDQQFIHKQQKINIKNLNIEDLEKEAEMIQQQIHTELYLTPKNIFEGSHYGLNYETRKEKKLRKLQENIQNNVEKILPNAKEQEVKRITQSIYDSVFGLLREKYNIEASSASKSSELSSSLQIPNSQNNLASFRGQTNSNIQNSARNQIKENQGLDFGFKKQDTIAEQSSIKKEFYIEQYKEINISPINVNENQMHISPQKLKDLENMKSKSNSHGQRDMYENTLMIPSQFEAEDEILSKERCQQSEEFKELLIVKEFEETGVIFDKHHQQQIDFEEKQWFDEIEINSDIKKSGGAYQNHSYEREIQNKQTQNYLIHEKPLLSGHTHIPQKNQIVLSPIRELESTYDQIQQSNFGKNTHQDINTSGDERLNSNQNNYETQRSRSNFQTKRGIEEEMDEEEDRNYIIQNNFSVKGSNNNNNNHFIQFVNNKAFYKTTRSSKEKIESFEQNVKLCNSEKLIQNNEQGREEQPDRNRQSYESSKQKISMYIPLVQQQDSQLICSVSPINRINQSSSYQSSLAHSRQMSAHHFTKQLNTIEEWDQILNFSKQTNKISNYGIKSSNNLHSRKNSLSNLASPVSAQNTRRGNGTSTNTNKKKDDKYSSTKSISFTQEYLKKCQSSKRQQENQEMERIKSTLIANFNNGSKLQKGDNSVKGSARQKPKQRENSLYNLLNK